MNFSGALANKPLCDGVFTIKAVVYIDNKSKDKVSNRNSLEAELKKEFNRLKKEKLKKFNKI